jgi:DNA-binding IclR family transcriptional regulator
VLQGRRRILPDVAKSAAGRLRAYTDPDDLEAEFEQIRNRGYAECVEVPERGMCSSAAPLGPPNQAPMMSIGATEEIAVVNPLRL